MSEHEFPVSLKLRIDWSDLDYFEHVNNVSFFRFIQASRVHYWDTIGLTKSHKETNIGAMLASCKCNFKRPLFYPGHVTVSARVHEIKNTSFSIHHQLRNDAGEIVAEAEDIVVVFDFNKNEKVPFPEELKKIVEKLENKVV